MGSQWRVATFGLGGFLRLGLDYAALPIVLAEHRAIAHRQPIAELMPQLRELEHAALDELNKRH